MTMLSVALVHQPRTLIAGAVFHSSVTAWSVLADGADSTDTIKVALIGGFFLVLAAAVPAWISARGARRAAQEAAAESPQDVALREAQQRYVAELTGDRDEWKKTAEAAIRGTEVRDYELDRLRRLVIDLGGNPFPTPVSPPSTPTDT